MKFLFVCTGNTCRSPMAEGILRKLAEDNNLDIEVKSAGLAVYENGPAADNSIKAMKAINIDISDHRSSQLNREMLEEAQIILTMSTGHKYGILMDFPQYEDKIYTLIEYAKNEAGDIGDPFGGSYGLYEKTRDEIAGLIQFIVEGL